MFRMKSSVYLSGLLDHLTGTGGKHSIRPLARVVIHVTQQLMPLQSLRVHRVANHLGGESEQINYAELALSHKHNRGNSPVCLI